MILSPKANDFILNTPEPPEWLTRICQSPMGKSLFLYILKDPVLHERLINGDYNGLIDFFTSTLVVNASDPCDVLNLIDLNCCSYATTILFFNRLLTALSSSTSYEECDQKITAFVDSYSFSSVRECAVFINYLSTLQSSFSNQNARSLLEVVLERVFAKVCKKHTLTPVSFLVMS